MSGSVALLRNYATWVRQLPQATGLMFAAGSPRVRCLKMVLFGVGMLLPLGSLIWALLYWHGNRVRR